MTDPDGAQIDEKGVDGANTPPCCSPVGPCPQHVQARAAGRTGLGYTRGGTRVGELRPHDRPQRIAPRGSRGHGRGAGATS